MGDNLIESLLNEIKRVEELLTVYKEIGPVGTFAHTMLTADVEAAKKALTDMDTVAMLRCYKTLQGAN